VVENNRKPIASLNMFPQFTTMNVIDGQAGVIIYSSLICHSLTIDNILNIIVLLILAGVTVATLTGDNGLLQKVEEAKNTNEEAKIMEEIILIYTEFKISQHDALNEKIEDFMKEKLQERYINNIVDVKKYNEKLIVSISNSISSKPQKYELNYVTGEIGKFEAIKYGNKSKETVGYGDKITIGNEKFKVFSTENNIIKAISWYNLILNANPIKQATEENVSSAGTKKFSSANYWVSNENMNDNAYDINMTEKNSDMTYKNYIQQYIDLYKKSLEDMGVEDINVRVCTKFELNSGLPNTLTSDEKKEIRNPSKIGSFWLSSGSISDHNMVYAVNNEGDIFADRYTRWDGAFGNNIGIRPIIEIY